MTVAYLNIFCEVSWMATRSSFGLDNGWRLDTCSPEILLRNRSGEVTVAELRDEL
jgi:hypothetical protein